MGRFPPPCSPAQRPCRLAQEVLRLLTEGEVPFQSGEVPTRRGGPGSSAPPGWRGGSRHPKGQYKSRICLRAVPRRGRETAVRRREPAVRRAAHRARLDASSPIPPKQSSPAFTSLPSSLPPCPCPCPYFSMGYFVALFWSFLYDLVSGLTTS